MLSNNWHNIFEQFAKQKVLIVGDAMLDAYMWGNIKRQSPEADVPVVNIEKYEKRLGGAANVAKNIASLGATPILCSVIGDNDQGFFLVKFYDLLKITHLQSIVLLQGELRESHIRRGVVTEPPPGSSSSRHF